MEGRPTIRPRRSYSLLEQAKTNNDIEINEKSGNEEKGKGRQQLRTGYVRERPAYVEVPPGYRAFQYGLETQFSL